MERSYQRHDITSDLFPYIKNIRIPYFLHKALFMDEFPHVYQKLHKCKKIKFDFLYKVYKTAYTGIMYDKDINDQYLIDNLINYLDENVVEIMYQDENIIKFLLYRFSTFPHITVPNPQAILLVKTLYFSFLTFTTSVSQLLIAISWSINFQQYGLFEMMIKQAKVHLLHTDYDTLYLSIEDENKRNVHIIKILKQINI